MQFSNSVRGPNMLRADHPLSNEQIASVAPSIFAAEAHESRSERYLYIPTVEVLDALREEGFEPFMASQTRVRHAGKNEHTKHMLRLRHSSSIMDKEADEIILLNSHDGSSSYQMIGGVFRFVCQNGLVIGDRSFDQKIRHSGNDDIKSDVIEGAYEVLDQFKAMSEQKECMKQIKLCVDQQEAFATAALSYRYDPQEGPAPVTARQLLSPRRVEDYGNDLWTTFNRIQENSIKGGLRGRNKSGRRATTRPVTGIDQDVKLNRALWTLAQEMRGHLTTA
jgi:hypothetical protein